MSDGGAILRRLVGGLTLAMLLCAMPSGGQAAARADSSQTSAAAAVAQSSTPAAAKPATAAQYAEWRSQIRRALFIPDPLPAADAHAYGSFSPAPGVVAERVSYATLYGMRVPAIVYRPEKASGRLPALIVVNGHAGDKTSWYAWYTGILYAKAGAVVVTYDPIGEDERNANRASGTRAHDAVVPGAEMPARLGGNMIADVMQAVSYAAGRADVDRARIGVLGFSMGSFHAALAGALDMRVKALVLSGGGNLSGAGDYWDKSPHVMCQSGPYKAIAFLSDRGADLYALNQQRGPTFIMNGMADPLIVSSNSFEPFFEEMRTRTVAVSGTRNNLFQTYFIPDAGHRPNFITQPGALWLQAQLRFPNWTEQSLMTMGVVRISEWAAKNGMPGGGFANGTGEGGMLAVDAGAPNVPREKLQALPDAEWQKHKSDYIYESWVERAKAASESARP